MNEDKTDNRLENLEYVTYAYNTLYSSTSTRRKNNSDYDIADYADIPGYCSYMISKNGSVYSKKIKRLILSIQIPSGYYKIKLKSDDGAYNDKYIHVLVAMTYLKYIPSTRLIVVNHIDGDKSNNTLANLEVITQKENSKHSVKINYEKLFKKPIYYIKDGVHIRFSSAKEAAITTHIDHSSIIKSCKSPTKTAGGIKWFYV